MTDYKRIYRDDPLPDFNEIKKFMGGEGTALYDRLESFIDGNYSGFEKEICFGGKKFGVMVRWRRSGKTLCSIFPENEGFSVVLVYGKKERELFIESAENFSPVMRDIYNNTHEYHDGKWLLIRVDVSSLVDEIMSMIKIKRKPDKKKG